MTIRPSNIIEPARWALPALVAPLLFAACGGTTESANDGLDRSDGTIEFAAVVEPDVLPVDNAAINAAPETIAFEPARLVGDDPFVISVVTPAADEIWALPAADRPTLGPGLYGGTGDDEVCDREQLAFTLSTMPVKAAAWAGVHEIAVDEISEYMATLTPALLGHDTRVTNHGFDGESAIPNQATLAAGTAVLIDAAGKVVTRCACGNPLDDPIGTTTPPLDVQVPETVPGQGVDEPETPGVVIDEPQPEFDADPELPVAAGESFCETLDRIRPQIEGPPASASAIPDYLIDVRDGLAELIAIAQTTPEFPTEGLADLIAYHAAIAAAVEAGGIPGSGDVDLRDRVEHFLLRYCDGSQPEIPATPDEDEVDDEVAGDIVDDVTPANCGSMQFFLLVAAAEELGLEHTAVSNQYLEALDAVVAGADPGDTFDVADLAPMLAYEEVGCAGAQAMQQFFDDSGVGHLIEGTELDG